MLKNIFAIFVIASLLVVNGQENAAPQPAAQEPSTVASLKRLSELTLAELDKKNQRTREAGDIAAKLKAISSIQNMESRILEYLRLQKRIAALQQAIQKANHRQADLAEEIRSISIDPKLSLQESERMMECRQYLDEFARAQRIMTLQLKRVNDNIQNIILKLPPPITFTTRCGIKMRFVKASPVGFYISESCVPAALFDEVRTSKALQREPFISGDYPDTNASASYTQAIAFCKWLSAYEFNTYKLPELKQLKILPNTNALPVKAVWSATNWSSDDINHNRAEERFGVKMQTVWDPQHLLSELEFTGELPDASYKNLGFLVVTNIATGVRLRLDALVKTVNEEKADNDTKQTE